MHQPVCQSPHTALRELQLPAKNWPSVKEVILVKQLKADNIPLGRAVVGHQQLKQLLER